MRPVLAACLLTGVLTLASLPAYAQDTAHAKEAYDRGVAAQAKGDFPRAAREFALADTLAPSAVALQAGLDAAVDADDPLIGGELLERSKRLTAPIGKALAQSVEAAKKKLGGRAGRVHVTCPAGATCTATLDGRSFDPRTTTWAPVGAHALVVQVDGDAQTKGVDVKADEIVDFAPTRKPAARDPLPVPVPASAPPLATTTPPPPATPPPATTPPAPSRPPAEPAASASAGLPPFVFFAGVGATVVAGAAMAYFMVTTRSKHDDFVGAGCESAPGAGCSALKKDGESSQTAANVGLGVTAVLAVATVVVGAAFTRWHGTKDAALLLVPRLGERGGSGASFALRF
ncbi:MAG TPA: hypothetical protein VLT33_47335 [Labilithrix sp.]|nr:hypothetical protein [Labilithrix sp.]